MTTKNAQTTAPRLVCFEEMQAYGLNNITARFHITRALEQLTAATEKAEANGFPLLAKLTSTTADALTNAAQQLNALAALARQELTAYTQED